MVGTGNGKREKAEATSQHLYNACQRKYLEYKNHCANAHCWSE